MASSAAPETSALLGGAGDLAKNAKAAAAAPITFIFNIIGVVVGLIAIWVGCMGVYYGYSLLELWPPLTWNNTINGVFMM
jgi:hypothetical protein